MAIYRPQVQGSGNEMVVSVEPSCGIYLKDLWEALEYAENSAWQKQRPNDNPRKIHSYLQDNGELVANAPNQPWWDDHGRYTLIAAPKNNAPKLSWQQLFDELWRLYQPAIGLKVNSYLYENKVVSISEESSDVHLCQSFTQQGKRLVAMRWDKNNTHYQSMLIPPTLTAILAALTQANFPLGVMLNDLPSANSYQVLDLLGGFAILSSDGVVLFNNWDSQSLDAGALTTEFFKLIHFA